MSEELLEAVRVGDRAKVRRMIAESVNINFTKRGYDAVELAAKHGRLEILQDLLAAGAKNRRFITTAINRDHFEIVQEWLKLPESKKLLNIDLESNEGITPLIQACSGGGVEMVKLLVDAGANVNSVSKDYETSLSRAVKSGNQDLVDYLWPLCSPKVRKMAKLPEDPRNKRLK